MTSLEWVSGWKWRRWSSWEKRWHILFQVIPCSEFSICDMDIHNSNMSDSYYLKLCQLIIAQNFLWEKREPEVLLPIYLPLYMFKLWVQILCNTYIHCPISTLANSQLSKLPYTSHSHPYPCTCKCLLKQFLYFIRKLLGRFSDQTF